MFIMSLLPICQCRHGGCTCFTIQGQPSRKTIGNSCTIILGKIPTNTWTANVAFFQLLLFAANIVHWFKRICLPKEYLTTALDTIRTDFLVLPAKLTKRGSQNILMLPKGYHHRQEFQQALSKIQKLRLPRNFRFCK